MDHQWVLKPLHEKYIQFQIVFSQISFYKGGHFSFPEEQRGRYHFNHINTVNNGKNLNCVHHIVVYEGYNITYIILLPKILYPVINRKLLVCLIVWNHPKWGKLCKTAKLDFTKCQYHRRWKGWGLDRDSRRLGSQDNYRQCMVQD